MRRALVKQHRDVGAKLALNRHRFPRAKEERLAAEVRPESKYGILAKERLAVVEKFIDEKDPASAEK